MKILFGLLFFLAGAWSLNAQAQLAHPCNCTTSTQWTNAAKDYGIGIHYIYSFPGQAIRKFSVHTPGGGTVPESAGGSTKSATTQSGAFTRSNGLVPDAQTLVVDELPVEQIYLDGFSDWLNVYNMTGGSMKTTVQLNASSVIGFPTGVSDQSAYGIFENGVLQNNINDWLMNQIPVGSPDLDSAAATIILNLISQNPLVGLELAGAEEPGLTLIIVLNDHAKVYFVIKKGDSRLRLTEGYDADNNTVPTSQAAIGMNYFFNSSGSDGVLDFLGHVQQMGVHVQAVYDTFIVTCVKAGGQINCHTVAH